MNSEDSRRTVVDCLLQVAPELDEADLDAEASLRDGAELDSMDFIAFVAALADALGRDIPEEDYGELDSVARASRYVEARG